MVSFDGLCVSPCELLLPKAGVDMQKWAVVACDQYTAQKEYWERADALVGHAPSALRLILPEAYLEESDARVPRAQDAMREYLSRGVLDAIPECMMLTARTTQSGTRLGLVACVDLEAYDFAPGSHSPVRATEGTIAARIPPRLKVRKNAPLELSHILVLLDDAQKTVIEPLYEMKDRLEVAYDTELMLGGGHITGYIVKGDELLTKVKNALAALKNALPDGAMFLAVGDGNHSLATARAHWLNVREGLDAQARKTHPARFAMVELTNLHDNALIFEPIHRVLFGAEQADIMRMLQPVAVPCEKAQADVRVLCGDAEFALRLTAPTYPLPVGTLQALLDEYLQSHESARIDYIHGEDAVRALVQNERAVGFLLPAMDKARLFPAVSAGGALPRKTFSMGEANEKRYYIEARRIV